MTASSSVAPPPVSVNLARKGDSLWGEAFRRLLRNKAAVVGGSIILVIVLVSILAPIIAVKSFEVQVPADNNKVPGWVCARCLRSDNFFRRSVCCNRDWNG